MDVLDVAILLLIPLSAIGGYRTGAVSQALGLAGLILALTLAWLVAPFVIGPTLPGWARTVESFSIIIVCVGGGYVFGSHAAKRARQRIQEARAKRVDALGGSFLSVSCLLLGTWFLGVNLAAGPFTTISDTLRGSASIRLTSKILPAPPRLMPALQTAADRFGFPDLFVGIPPVPGPPVQSVSASETEQAAKVGLRSSIEVLGTGCSLNRFNEGSGFVVAPGYVVTSAHVVAGTQSQFLFDGTRRYAARLVAIDADLDVAVLRAATFPGEPMSLADQEVARGSGGAVVGFPAGYHPTSSSATVRDMVDVLAHTIYGDGVVRRRLYELQAKVAPGDSGGPFVLPDGRAAGLVAYTSVLDPSVAYAVPSGALKPIVEASLGHVRAVSSGVCAFSG